MMDTYGSRLDFLMNTMGITGRELAAAIHVDPSLVSKWRNNHRALTKRSSHLSKVAEYVVSCDGCPSVEEVLEAVGSEVISSNREEFLTLLCEWLTDHKPLPSVRPGDLVMNNRYSHNASYGVYLGDKGRREAVLQFLDHVLSLSQGQQLHLMSQEDLAWLVEDTAFLAEWQDKLIQLLKKKHQIKIIHWVDRSVDSLNSIIGYWLPLHLMGGIESWFVPKYSDSPFHTTLFILKDELAIYGMSSPSLKDHRYTAIFRDPVTVKHYQWIFSTHISNCRPLIEVCPKTKIGNMLQSTAETMYTDEIAYLIWNPPSFLTMTQSLVTSILARYNLQDRLIAGWLKYCLQSSNAEYRLPSRLLCNLEGLQKAIQEAPILCEDLSAIANQPIWLSKEDLNQYIYELVEHLQSNEGLEIAFLSPSEGTPVNLFVRSSDLVVAWSKELPYAAAVSEPTVTQAFSRYYDEIWQSIPRVNRDQAWVSNELLKLICT